MYKIKFTCEFKHQMKLCNRRGYDMEKLQTAIRILSTEGKLPAEYQPHVLHGDRQGQWECHIQPNWLLIWERLRVGELARECNTTRNSSS